MTSEPESNPLARGAKILFVCDSIGSNLGPPKPKYGEPWTNGVSNMVRYIIDELRGNYKIFVLHPYMQDGNSDVFKRFTLPRYPQVELAIPNPFRTWKIIRNFEPDAIFIITPDGPLGRTAKLLCHFPGSRFTKNGRTIPYVLAYTTNLDDYLSLYISHHTGGLIKFPSKTFHSLYKLTFRGANKVLVPTRKYQVKLHLMGIDKTAILPRGVASVLFRPIQTTDRNPYYQYTWFRKNPLPIYLYHGRVSLLKGIENFLSLHTPCAYKVVIGEGPYRKTLERKFIGSSVRFLGARYDEELAAHIRFADLSFFPSKTDTWGQAITEAGASGIPVIAYDTPGPGEIIIPGITGVLIQPDSSLGEGIHEGIRMNRELCAQTVVARYSWKQTARTFINNLPRIAWKSHQS